eukprot:CAMPEP_0119268146 /NCGR_PEP_ID=MMETSP1329-20130426/6023_1 /TAXON_ID=114041 /ORGANISM="Genus nov. species nov., Strain RCC1024" /LENGTH=228 /DNA_ID=CAMNT_0007268103 /DNA_START=243 /DNA_END=930 /DNA_ORIENTATION=-
MPINPARGVRAARTAAVPRSNEGGPLPRHAPRKSLARSAPFNEQRAAHAGEGAPVAPPGAGASPSSVSMAEAGARGPGGPSPPPGTEVECDGSTFSTRARVSFAEGPRSTRALGPYEALRPLSTPRPTRGAGTCRPGPERARRNGFGRAAAAGPPAAPLAEIFLQRARQAPAPSGREFRARATRHDFLRFFFHETLTDRFLLRAAAVPPGRRAAARRSLGPGASLERP